MRAAAAPSRLPDPLTYRYWVYKSKQYGMPFGPDVRVLFANASVLSSVGLDANKPAQNWDELEDHARRMTRDEGGRLTRVGFPPFWGSGGNNLWLIPFWQLGGETLSADRTRVTIDNEHGLRALEWIKRLHDIQGGWNAIDTLRRSANDRNILFVNGVTGYYFAASAERQRGGIEASGIKFNAAPWPVPRGGRRANYGGCHSYCITTQAKAPAAAWRLLEFLADDKNNLRVAQHYDRLPIRVKTAQSTAYHRNDPFSMLSVEEMNHRRFTPAVPGNSELETLLGSVAADVASGKRAARDALKETAHQMQQVLDKWKK